jgi:hypothetical protein
MMEELSEPEPGECKRGERFRVRPHRRRLHGNADRLRRRTSKRFGDRFLHRDRGVVGKVNVCGAASAVFEPHVQQGAETGHAAKQQRARQEKGEQLLACAAHAAENLSKRRRPVERELAGRR